MFFEKVVDNEGWAVWDATNSILLGTAGQFNFTQSSGIGPTVVATALANYFSISRVGN